MPTNVYVDGFNLYYGAVSRTPYKWLNVATMCQILFPGININRIRYFTARVKGLPHDPKAPFRQGIYLRALRTIPNLETIRGRFVAWPRLMPQFPLAYLDPQSPPQKPPQNVQVLRMEEKRSDVNLASHLLLDCFDNDFDEAIVVSNDSDLTLPIEIVVSRFKKTVTVVNPYRNKPPSGDLERVATRCVRGVNPKVLAASQFSTTLTDARGTFSKPSSW